MKKDGESLFPKGSIVGNIGKADRYMNDTEKSNHVMLNASDTVYTVRDIANMLSRKECTIRRRIENGLIPAHKVGRCWYILKSEFVGCIRDI